MKKLTILLSMVLFLGTSAFAQKATSDMTDNASEYENTQAQWFVKEGLGFLYSELVYAGWKVEVNKKGEKTVDVQWKNAFTEKMVKKQFGNSSQYLKAGLAGLIGDKQAPITEAEAKDFYNDLKLTLQLEDLRLKYDSDFKVFQEEFAFLKEYGIVTLQKENEVLQRYADLAEWRDTLVDEVSSLEWF